MTERVAGRDGQAREANFAGSSRGIGPIGRISPIRWIGRGDPVRNCRFGR